MSLPDKLIKELRDTADEKHAAHHTKFFKAFEGGYGEGDIFWGQKVPMVKKIAAGYKNLPLGDVEKLLQNSVHEVRFAALNILVNKTKNPEHMESVKDIYLRNLKHINNWDLVDASAPYIIGRYCYEKGDDIIRRLAVSGDLWPERTAIIATLFYIRKGCCDLSFELAEGYMLKKHDLLQKASGWVLREAGKKGRAALVQFLDLHHKNMPRTMLRYSIEKFTPEERAHYMKR